MQIDRRITNGLAWAGVLLVVGVPTADLLSAQFMGERETMPQVAVVEPVAPVPAPASQRPSEPAPTEVAAATTKPRQPATVVDSFVQSGRKLPSYITGGSDEPAPAAAATQPVVTTQPVKPVATTPTPTPSISAVTTQPARNPIATAPAVEPSVVQPATDPISVASIPPTRVAPVPMPLSMRPRSVATVTQQPRAPSQQVVIPQSVTPDYAPQVTARDLDDWETGPLSEFLAQREGGGRAVRPQVQQPVEPYYQNGGYLDQVQPQSPRDRYVGPADQQFFFPFTN